MRATHLTGCCKVPNIKPTTKVSGVVFNESLGDSVYLVCSTDLQDDGGVGEDIASCVSFDIMQHLLDGCLPGAGRAYGPRADGAHRAGCRGVGG